MNSADWFAARGIVRTDGELMLVIPDCRQTTDYGCGRACVDAVAEFHGLRPPRSSPRWANAVQGMAPDTVAAALRSLGLAVLAGGPMEVATLKALVGAGWPVICPVTRSGVGHWVVVRGVWRGRVYFHCPSWGACSEPVATWESQWRDATDTGTPFVRWGVAAGPPG